MFFFFFFTLVNSLPKNLFYSRSQLPSLFTTVALRARRQSPLLLLLLLPVLPSPPRRLPR